MNPARKDDVLVPGERTNGDANKMDDFYDSSKLGLRHITTLAEYQQAIKGNGLIVVDFFASWCPPCKEIAPKFEALTGKYKDVTLIKVDVDANKKEISQKLEIESMPNFKFYKGGVEVHEI